jgi:hypothetical protein
MFKYKKAKTYLYAGCCQVFCFTKKEAQKIEEKLLKDGFETFFIGYSTVNNAWIVAAK